MRNRTKKSRKEEWTRERERERKKFRKKRSEKKTTHTPPSIYIMNTYIWIDVSVKQHSKRKSVAKWVWKMCIEKINFIYKYTKDGGARQGKKERKFSNSLLFIQFSVIRSCVHIQRKSFLATLLHFAMGNARKRDHKNN